LIGEGGQPLQLLQLLRTQPFGGLEMVLDPGGAGQESDPVGDGVGIVGAGPQGEQALISQN
jgi:hypothetical protein